MLYDASERPDVRVLWDKRPVARKSHLCDHCGEEIAPDTRYESTGVIIDGVFEATKLHLGAYRYPSGCPALRLRDQSELAAQFEADRALFPESKETPHA